MEKQTKVEIFSYEKPNGVDEYHAMIHINNVFLSYKEQVDLLLKTYKDMQNEKFKNCEAVFVRFFLSDAANQSEYLKDSLQQINCAVSIIEQPPLNGSKISMWVYLQKNVTVKALSDGFFEVKHNIYRHLWKGGSYNYEKNSESQTFALLDEYTNQLQKQNCTLADNCIRTWFFVQDVDVNYAGVVKARNDIFATQNLTIETHYISSTGISGRNGNPKVSVQMDTYAVDGLKSEQIHFLYAPTHLNKTSEYGVSFERGTYIDYGDRRHVFISGTASIDNKGNVLYVGDIRKQTYRMLENVETLLQEAECSFENVGQIIVYLRDIADYVEVKSIFEQNFPNKPVEILLAPVCRQGWLIEMECMAVKELKSDYADF